MAAAAVTRGTPGGKSQGLSPASPPPRQGAQLHAVRVWSTAPGTTVPPPRSPPPCCFRPPSLRQGAPLGAGPHHRPESAGTAPRPPHPATALPLARQVFVNSVQLLLQNIRVSGRDPPTSKILPGPPPPLGGAPHPQRQACHRPEPPSGPQSHPSLALHPGKLPSQGCAPAPYGGLLIPTLASLHTTNPEWVSTPSPSLDTWQNPRREPPPAPICSPRGRRLRLEPEQ